MYPRILQKIDNTLVNCINKYANRHWYGSPLINRLNASESEYLAIAKKAKEKV